MLTIYGVPLSVHTRKALMVAMHKGLEHRFEVVIPVIPGNPPANWGSLSPTGLIPVLQDGDFTLADSTAISLYLEKKYPQIPILPADEQQYGQVLWINAYVGDSLWRQVVHPLFHQTVVGPNINKIPTDQAVVDQALSQAAPRIFNYLEGQIDGQFLVGSALTLADMAVASNFLIYQYCGFTVDVGQYPKLARYLRDIVRVPLFQKALEQEKPFAEQMGLNLGFLN